ncbi:hypothetical protein GCM10023310_36910 [Paenibacillus vulneris]|uniref:Uncharacterized protein n=1 Tax=Paenibacillus vulneris TaxID=1133364 RepID=A0ABW3UU27_9BACL
MNRKYIVIHCMSDLTEPSLLPSAQTTYHITYTRTALGWYNIRLISDSSAELPIINVAPHVFHTLFMDVSLAATVGAKDVNRTMVERLGFNINERMEVPA